MNNLLPLVRAAEVLGIPRSTIQTWIHRGILEPKIRSEPRNPTGHQLSISDLVYCLVIRTLFMVGVPMGYLIDKERRRSAQRDMEAENYNVVIVWRPDLRMLARYRYEDMPHLLDSNPIIWVKIAPYYDKVMRRLDELDRIQIWQASDRDEERKRNAS